MEWIEKIWHENRPFLLMVVSAGFVLFWGQSTIASYDAEATSQTRRNEEFAATNEARELSAKELRASLEQEWSQLNADDNPAVARVTGLLFERRPAFQPPEGNPVIAYNRLRSEVIEQARRKAQQNAVDSELTEGLDLPDTFTAGEASETYTRLDLTARVIDAALDVRVSRIEDIRQIPRRKKRDGNDPLLETPVEVTVVGSSQAVHAWLHTFGRRASFAEMVDIEVRAVEGSEEVRGRAIFHALEVAPEGEGGEEDGGQDPEGVPELPGLPVLPGG